MRRCTSDKLNLFINIIIRILIKYSLSASCERMSLRWEMFVTAFWVLDTSQVLLLSTSDAITPFLQAPRNGLAMVMGGWIVHNLGRAPSLCAVLLLILVVPNSGAPPVTRATLETDPNADATLVSRPFQHDQGKYFGMQQGKRLDVFMLVWPF